jgi:hypothetical protein
MPENSVIEINRNVIELPQEVSSEVIKSSEIKTVGNNSSSNETISTETT